MSINLSTPSDVAEVIASSITSLQSGIEIGTSTNPYEIYTSVLNAAGGILVTTPSGAPINAAALTNGTISSVQKWSTGALEPSDIVGLTGTALTLTIAAAAIAGTPVTAGALIIGFGLAWSPGGR